AVLLNGGDEAEEGPQGVGEDDRRDADLDRDRPAAANQTGHGFGRPLERDAEVEMQDAPDVFDVLDDDRFVEPVLVELGGTRRRRQTALAGIERSARDRVHEEKGDQRDGEQDEDEAEHPSQDVAGHGPLPTLTTGCAPKRRRGKPVPTATPRSTYA